MSSKIENLIEKARFIKEAQIVPWSRIKQELQKILSPSEIQAVQREIGNPRDQDPVGTYDVITLSQKIIAPANRPGMERILRRFEELGWD